MRPTGLLNVDLQEEVAGVEGFGRALLRVHDVLSDAEKELDLCDPVEHDLQLSRAEEVGPSGHDEIEYVCILLCLQSRLQPLRQFQVDGPQGEGGLVVVVVLESGVLPQDEVPDFPPLDESGLVERRGLGEVPAHEDLRVGLVVALGAVHHRAVTTFLCHSVIWFHWRLL